MSGWITDRPPIDTDTSCERNLCVEVTYQNGLIGWEPVSALRQWSAYDSGVMAWRRIRPAWKGFKSDMPEKYTRVKADEQC